MSDRIIRSSMAAAAVVFVASLGACGRAELATAPDLGVENQRPRHTVSGDTTASTVNGIFGLGSGNLIDPPMEGTGDTTVSTVNGIYSLGSGGLVDPPLEGMGDDAGATTGEQRGIFGIGSGE